jgi:hypothetical protein
MNNRFEFGTDAPPDKQENCTTCESYYTGACDGLRGYCKSYKQYRVRTLEELIKVAIGTTVLVGGVLLVAILTGIWILR